MAKKKNAFNTITPVTKAVALILFVVLPFLGLYIGVQYGQKTASNDVSEVDIIANTQLPGWKTYSGEGFNFKYPPDFEIAKELTDEVIFDADRKLADSSPISLKSSTVPFKVPAVGDTFASPTGQSIKIQYVSKEHVEDGGKIRTRYDFSCNTDCGHQVVYFKVGDTYYQLTMYVSGGGLEEIFSKIIASLEY